jgi:hypothetical protein
VQYGPDITAVKSSTRISSRMPGREDVVIATCFS